MQFFLDSAEVGEIAAALERYDIDGITTNPRHVQTSGKPFLKVIHEIVRLVEGTPKTVSAEVNPHLEDWAAMVDEGRRLAEISPNIVVKIHCVDGAFRAVRELKRHGIRTNVTLIFSAAQGLQAMRSGAFYISPFVGWKEANAEDTRGFISDLVAMKRNGAYPTEILVAAVRNGRQIVDAAVAGADIVTAGLAVYKEAFEHPYTRDGLSRFQAFWDQSAYE
jgi:transaldolase